jgi:Component of IIS longevity pathway SMK-1
MRSCCPRTCATTVKQQNAEVVAKIHQNFRVSFLKDVLLRPMMDDAVAATLNSVTYFNNGFIVKALHDESSNYVRRVFLKLKESDLPQVGVSRCCMYTVAVAVALLVRVLHICSSI